MRAWPLILRPIASAVGVSLALANPALSQSRDPASAEKLYEDGSKLLKAGDWAGACARFEESYQLDPAPGTVLNLASCAEHDGKIALAWSRFKDARSLNADTKGDKRREEIERFIVASLARLEPRIPYLTVRVANPPEGLRVTRDGQPTTAGVELPIDPGKHVIAASAPGHAEAKREITIGEGKREAIDLELTRVPDDAPAPAPTPTPAPTTTPAPTPTVTPPPPGDVGGMSTARVAGLVVGGAGVVALGVSMVTGVVALGKQSDLEELDCQPQGDALVCGPNDLQKAQNLSSSGSTMAAVSTVTTLAGAALVGTGLLLYVVGGSSSKEGRSVGYGASFTPGRACAWVEGSF